MLVFSDLPLSGLEPLCPAPGKLAAGEIPSRIQTLLSVYLICSVFMGESEVYYLSCVILLSQIYLSFPFWDLKDKCIV